MIYVLFDYFSILLVFVVWVSQQTQPGSCRNQSFLRRSEVLATERGAMEAEEAGNEDFPRILLVWKENPPKKVLEYVGEGKA